MATRWCIQKSRKSVFIGITCDKGWSRSAPGLMNNFSLIGEDVHSTGTQDRDGADVVDSLERVCTVYGFPNSTRVNQGPAFISRDLDL